jgi:battenin
MLLIALTPDSQNGGADVVVKMLGVMLASLSSGGGELSFLGLTHYYGPFSLAAWGSGTGGAGLIGAGAYVMFTTWIGLSVKTTLLSFSFLPIVMIASFFLVLPRGPLKHGKLKQGSYETILPTDPDEEDQIAAEDGLSGLEADSLLSTSREFVKPADGIWIQVKSNLYHARTLFFP